MENAKRRAEARRRGVTMARKLTGVAAGVGLVLAGVGVVSASAATSAPATLETHDDTRPLPFEGQAQVKSCGCTPCWGPPAPPRARTRKTRRARRGARR